MRDNYIDEIDRRVGQYLRQIDESMSYDDIIEIIEVIDKIKEEDENLKNREEMSEHSAWDYSQDFYDPQGDHDEIVEEAVNRAGVHFGVHPDYYGEEGRDLVDDYIIKIICERSNISPQMLSVKGHLFKLFGFDEAHWMDILERKLKIGREFPSG